MAQTKKGSKRRGKGGGKGGSDKPKLRLTLPDGSRRTVTLQGKSLVVGKGDEAALKIDDPSIEDLHLRVKMDGETVTITDLGGSAGTTVDGNAIGETETALTPESRVVIGGTKIKLVAAKPKFEKGTSEASAPASAPSDGASSAGSTPAKAQVVKVESSPAPMSAAAQGATDGNAALVMEPEPEPQLAPEPEPEPEVDASEEKTEIAEAPKFDHDEDDDYAFDHLENGRRHLTASHDEDSTRWGRSVLDRPVINDSDDRFHDFATRFLSKTLPESLRPTATNKRLQLALVWGRDQFLDVADLSPGDSLTVGSSDSARFHVYDEIVGESIPLVVPEGDGFKILLREGGKPIVHVKGEKTALSKLDLTDVEVPVKGKTYKIGLDDRISLHFGNLQIYARYTKPQITKTRPIGQRTDINFLTTLIILLLTGLALERMVAITDFANLSLSDDLFKNKDRFAKYIAKVAKPEKKTFEDLSGVKEGAKAKDDEGKFGKKEADKKKAAPSEKGSPVVDVDKREEDRKKVMNSGLIALLGGAGMGDAASNVFGPGGIGTGLNNMLGGRDGAAGMGDAQGVGGLGSRGGGSGGGGTALGIGGLGGKGSGRGRGGSGEFDLGGRGKGKTRFVPGKTTVIGGLSADEVGRIIRRHWNEIKYCYEKELMKNPNLYGKVSVFFIIGPVGDVTEASVRESTMNSGAVENCMLRQVKRWKFPSPRGGGIVQVNYPFIFKPQD